MIEDTYTFETIDESKSDLDSKSIHNYIYDDYDDYDACITMDKYLLNLFEYCIAQNDPKVVYLFIQKIRFFKCREFFGAINNNYTTFAQFCNMYCMQKINNDDDFYLIIILILLRIYYEKRNDCISADIETYISNICMKYPCYFSHLIDMYYNGCFADKKLSMEQYITHVFLTNFPIDCAFFTCQQIFCVKYLNVINWISNDATHYQMLFE